jgi:hypothetical protein
LINAGAGQWIAGHYVPVAAFGDPFTLHFLLQSRGRLPWTQIGCLLIERFERDERGPMVMETRGPVSRDDPSYALWKLLQEQNRQTA